MALRINLVAIVASSSFNNCAQRERGCDCVSIAAAMIGSWSGRHGFCSDCTGVWFLGFCRFTVEVVRFDEKSRENLHSFSYRFPQTAPNVDAQNPVDLGPT
ncbi:hypothetical protein FF2_038431 [Malus domestica]